MTDRDLPPGFDAALLSDDVAFWDDGGDRNESLVDLINRVLDRGVVITGDVTISVAGVDLVYLGLNALLTSVSTARRKTLAPPRDGARDG
jgi:hypothetical protein